MDTHINIVIHGYDWDSDPHKLEFSEQLEYFLSVGRPWVGNPDMRLQCAIQVTDPDAQLTTSP